MPFKRKIPGLPLACNERSQTASGSHLVCVDLLPLLNALPHQKSDFAFFNKHRLWDHRCVSTLQPLHQVPLAQKTESPYHASQGSDSC